jgi:hypothetical protein
MYSPACLKFQTQSFLLKESVMRKILFAAGLMAALIFTLVASAAAPTSFAGTWSLDKSKSQNLNRRLQGAESVSWTITQNDKQVIIEEKVTGGEMAGGGASGGGGGGRGGFGGPMGPRTYNLDGSDVTFEMGPAKGTRKAAWSSDGKTLELTTKSTFTGQNGEQTLTSTDKLQLSGDGKVLTVNSHRESPRGPQDSTLVFNK